MTQVLYQLPNGWEWQTLGKVVDKTENLNPLKDADKLWTYIDISSIDRNMTVISEPKKILGKDAPSRAKKQVQEGDVLFATTRPNLKNIALVNQVYNSPVASTGFCVLRASSSVLSAYLFYFITTDFVQNQIEPFVGGASYPAITDNNLKKTPIPVPNLKEQKRIIEKLDALFSHINSSIAHLKENLTLTAALLKSSLSSSLLSKGHWELVELSDVCQITTKLCDPREKKYLDMYHIGGANITSFSGELFKLKTAREEKLISGKFPFDTNMVLYSKIRPYLMKVAKPNISGICSADIYPLTPNKQKITRDFLFYLLLSEQFTQYAIEGSSRAGMPKVNRNHLFNFKFHLPPLDEQEAICESLASLNQKTNQLNSEFANKLAYLVGLKSSILNSAFKGEL
jgi:type I restriction enzyme S subunit